MKMKAILVSLAVLLSVAGYVQAQERDLSGTIELTYLSKFLWRGFDYYEDDHSAIQPGIDLDLYGTGLGVRVLWSRAVHGGFENAERISTTLYFGNSIYEGEDYTTNYETGWVYYGFPDEPRGGVSGSQAADMQEIFASFCWPEICPAGVVPSYTVLTMWPSESKSQAHGNAGWAHILGLGYDLTVPSLMPELPEQIVHLSAEIVYNDGVAPGVFTGSKSGTVDHDWSHALFGIATDFDLENNLTFTPAIYYQASMDDSVNREDEFMVSLNLKYPF